MSVRLFSSFKLVDRVEKIALTITSGHSAIHRGPGQNKRAGKAQICSISWAGTFIFSSPPMLMFLVLRPLDSDWDSQPWFSGSRAFGWTGASLLPTFTPHSTPPPPAFLGLYLQTAVPGILQPPQSCEPIPYKSLYISFNQCFISSIPQRTLILILVPRVILEEHTFKDKFF